MKLDGVKIRDCVGCGYCCKTAPCAASVKIHPCATECPELKWDGSRYICRLMTLPGDLGMEYRLELGAGAGCCSGLNDWRKDVKKRDPLPPPKKNFVPKEMQMFLRSLADQWISGDQMYLMLLNFKKRLMIDSGYSEEDASEYVLQMNHYLHQNRSSSQENFMG